VARHDLTDGVQDGALERHLDGRRVLDRLDGERRADDPTHLGEERVVRDAGQVAPVDLGHGFTGDHVDPRAGAPDGGGRRVLVHRPERAAAGRRDQAERRPRQARGEQAAQEL
jgi:hypothetical protein